MSWFKALFRPKADENAGAAMSVAEPCYAMGDVHGRLDLFERMLAALKADWAASGRSECPVLYCLGDLVDRGTQSKGVVEAFLALQQQDWCQARLLMGNHEEAMLQFMAEPEFGPTWITYGGAQTLLSYGVTPPPVGSDAVAWAEASRAFSRAVPEAHKQLFQTSPDMIRNGDYVFVHAGVRPGVPLDSQSAADFRWIRRDFLDCDKACDGVVVHGHTPTDDVENLPWRIGLDTGAYASGVLSAVRLIEAERKIIKVGLAGVLS